MSIYRPRKFTADHDVTAPIALPAAVPVISRLHLARHEDRTHLRRANPATTLLPIGRKWLANLPLNVRPILLVKRFPRIVNLIALEWDNEPMITRTLLDLLADHRGGRSGFPADIFRELRVIHGHYYSQALS